jgi:hypothetical protein
MENEFKFEPVIEGKMIGLKWNQKLMQSEYCWIDDPDYVKPVEKEVVDKVEKMEENRISLPENFCFGKRFKLR